MKIIFSPSKEMREENIFEQKIEGHTMPRFEEKTLFLNKKLKNKSLDEIANIMKLKGNLLEKTYENIKNFDKLKSIPAISMYYGVAFKELDLIDYSKENLNYLADNVFILSAFYGASSPFDLLKNYRLDMTMNILEGGLYNFWKKDINDYLQSILKKDEILLNLASGEFSKLIDKKVIDIISLDFREEKNGIFKSVSSYSKQARGKFLDYIIKNRIEDVEKIKNIEIAGYKFNENLSDERNFIFIR